MATKILKIMGMAGGNGLAGRVAALLFWLLACSTAGAQTVYPPELENTPSVELGALILALMPPAGSNAVDWDHGTDTPITWITHQYASAKTGDGETYWRDGIVRSSVQGQLSTYLDRRKLELGWTVTLLSKLPPKFGPQSIALRPGTPNTVCFGSLYTNCWFDAPLRSLQAASVRFKSICMRKSGIDVTRGYELNAPGKRPTVMLWSESGGSGGMSSDITLKLAATADAKACNEDAAPEVHAPDRPDARRATVARGPSPATTQPLATSKSDPLKYDAEEARRREIFNSLFVRTSQCMSDGAVAMLRQGSRDRDQIVGFTKGTCGTPLRQFMEGTLARPPAEVDAFINVIANDRLNRIIGLR